MIRITLTQAEKLVEVMREDGTNAVRVTTTSGSSLMVARTAGPTLIVSTDGRIREQT